MDISKRGDIIESIKSYCDQEKLILLGVDLYNWVSDNFHWHRNHIDHFALINGYDESNHIIFILETGVKGYAEYQLDYSEVEKAAKNFTGPASGLCDINRANTPKMFTYKD